MTDKDEKSKKRRQRIESLLLSGTQFRKQEEISKKYNEEFNESVSQSTISRDLIHLGYELSEKLGTYILKEELEREKQLEDLKNFVSLSKASINKDDICYTVLKCDPNFSSVLCSKLENLYPSISLFPGFNGSILILMPDNDEQIQDEILSLLSK